MKTGKSTILRGEGARPRKKSARLLPKRKSWRCAKITARAKSRRFERKEALRLSKKLTVGVLVCRESQDGTCFLRDKVGVFGFEC